MSGKRLANLSVDQLIQRFIEISSLRMDHRYSRGLLICCPTFRGGGTAADLRHVRARPASGRTE